LENKYKALVQGKTILESSLHTNLSEHLNSEIGLGTITNVTSAKEWLRGSFLFQRIRKNPKHYALGKDDAQTWEDRVEDLVIQSVAKLRETQLIEAGGNDGENEDLVSTEYGDIMSKVGNRKLHICSAPQTLKLYIRQSTVCMTCSCRCASLNSFVIDGFDSRTS
jgi:ATP-dependent DNA helicase HFM1/MER3